MSRKTRWILFYSAVIIFFVLSYVMVVYALGYKYDVTSWEFVRTGSFRLVVNARAKVYVNNSLAGETSFLGDTYAKGRLLPRTYAVRLEREGYHLWEKNITIAAGYFADFPKIMLVPIELPTEPVASSSFGFPMPDSNIRVTKGKSLAFDQHTVSIEWLDDTDFQPFHRAGDFETVFGVPTVIDDVQWYRDREHLLVATNGKLYFYEIDVRGGINTYELTNLEGPFVYSEDDNVIYKTDGNQVVRFKI